MHYNPYSFNSDDVIVWNKVICQYGAVAPLIMDGDDIRVASDSEVDTYNLKSN